MVDHPLFRRLKHIRQNGLLFHVFPSATHHRFEHSIGVLHVANQMLDELRLNSVVGRMKGAVASLAHEGDDVAVDISELDELTAKWLVRLVRISALVHDLGHGPLSHTFDSFAPSRENLLRLLAANVIPSIGEYAETLALFDRDGMPGSPKYDLVPHEVMSCVLFAHIWQELRSENDSRASARDSGVEPADDTGAPVDELARFVPDDPLADERFPLCVAAAILGEKALVSRFLDRRLLEWLPLVHDMMASAPADADRMDYLERDSRAAGVTYGLFDRPRVMKSFLCFRQRVGNDTQYRLGIKRSGLPAVENFVQARYELFVQVYYHKTNAAISRMRKEIASMARRDSVSLFPVQGESESTTWRRWVSLYLDLSDDFFMRVLRGLEPEILPAVPAEVAQLATAVHNREIWKRVYEGEELHAREVVLALSSQFPSLADELVYDASDPKATKDLDSGACLLSRREDGLYFPSGETNWYRSSIIIDALHRAEANLGRVYARGRALDKTSLAELRTAARAVDAQLQRDAASDRALRQDAIRLALEQVDGSIAFRRRQSALQVQLDLEASRGS